MKFLFAIVIFLGSCATTDKLQDNLPQYVTRCGCMLQDDAMPNHNLDWHDKSALKKQFKTCQCSVEFGFDDINDPLAYIKPGTTFYQKKKGYPWDPDFKRIEQVQE